jgi:hypothetical protein
MSKVYRHYKGNYYRILSIADHTETREKMVVYEQLYTNEYPYGYIWCRPYNMFYEEIIYNNKIIPRFEWVENVEQYLE